MRPLGHRFTVTALAVAVWLAASAAPEGQQGTPRQPRLAVIIVVDQMRADYVDRFRERMDRRPEAAGDRGRMVLARGLSLPDDVHVRRPRHDRNGRVSAHPRHPRQRLVRPRARSRGRVRRGSGGDGRPLRRDERRARALRRRQRVTPARADVRRRNARATSGARRDACRSSSAAPSCWPATAGTR